MIIHIKHFFLFFTLLATAASPLQAQSSTTDRRSTLDRTVITDPLHKSKGRSVSGSSLFRDADAPSNNYKNNEKHDPLIPGLVRKKILVETIIFSLQEGIYQGDVSLEMSTSAPDAEIRYTTDGKIPDTSDIIYDSPLTLTEPTLIRARVYRDTMALSPVYAKLFVVNDSPHLPLLSLACDPDDLFDYHTGIYTNWEQQGDAWERPALLTLIEDGKVQFSAPTGIRIHGENSRGRPKKGFRVYFRSQYGLDKLRYPLFPQIPIDEFNSIIIYPPSSDNPSGWVYFTLLHDALTHAVFARIGGLYSAFKPVCLYLNGAYWGIYWIREHVDDDYLKAHCGIEHADLLRSSRNQFLVREGDTDFAQETLVFLYNSALDNKEKYNKFISDYINIDNFTDYYIMNVFADNKDWPHNNMDWFRDRDKKGKWHWLLWDADVCWRYNPDAPTLEWATRATIRPDIMDNDSEDKLWATLMIRKLLANVTYKNKFITRFADLMNTAFTPGTVMATLDSLEAIIHPEINREVKRWNDPNNAPYDRNLVDMHTFITSRCSKMRNQLVNFFGLPGLVTVTLMTNPDQGTIKLNTIEPSAYPWAGTYFKEVPITVTAIPASGYRFQGWQDTHLPADSIITLSLTGDREIEPIFIPDPSISISSVAVSSITPGSAVISWQSGSTSLGFVNYGTDSSLDIRLWEHSASITHNIQITSLNPDTEYLFRLGAVSPSGDTSRSGLYSLHTSESSPAFFNILSVQAEGISATTANITWQTDIQVDGGVWYGTDSTSLSFYPRTHCEFASFFIHHAYLENLTPDTRYYFRISCQIGNSGPVLSPIDTFHTAAETETGIDNGREQSLSLYLSQNYPNPFNPSTRIFYSIDSRIKVVLSVYTIEGQQLATLVDMVQDPGRYSVEFQAENLPPGVYLYRLVTDKKSFIKKMTIIH